MPKKSKIIAKWSEIEQWVWQEIQQGRIANFNKRYGKVLDPTKPDDWNHFQKDRQLSQSFLATILTDKSFSSVTPFTGVRIIGAYFEEEVDLRYFQIERHLLLDKCRFRDNLNLAEIHVNGGFSLDGSYIGGSVDLGVSVFQKMVNLSNSTFKQDVDLRGVKIGGYLSMNGGTFESKLDMNGIEVSNALVMSGKATFKEDVVLIGAKIKNQLSMVNSTFDGKLYMNEIEVGQHFLMSDKTIFKKEVDLKNAKISGQLSMDRSIFESKLDMNGIEVGQSIFARDTIFPSNQKIIINFAKIGSEFDLSGAELCQIDLTSTTMRELRLGSGIGHGPTKWLGCSSRMILRNTTVDSIQDSGREPESLPGKIEPEGCSLSWPSSLELEGFSYGHLGGYGAKGAANIANRSATWFITWLELDKTDPPQPYEQLADKLHQLGFQAKGNAVRFACRKISRKSKNTQGEGKLKRWPRMAGLWLLEVTIGYGIGSGYFRVLGWFLGITMFGFIVLYNSIERYSQDWDLFKMFWASFDQVLPIVELNRDHQEWLLCICNNWGDAYFYCQKLVGYVLGGFLAAGLAGLTQRN